MVLKTIIARAVSSHFMKEAHFAKMKIALEKARVLLLLEFSTVAGTCYMGPSTTSPVWWQNP